MKLENLVRMVLAEIYDDYATTRATYLSLSAREILII